MSSLLSFALTFVGVIIARNIPLLGAAFDLLIVTGVHEISHALVGNLGGQFSVPTPMGLTVTYSAQRSILLSLFFLGISSSLLFFCYQRHSIIFIRFLSVLVVLQVIFSFFLSDRLFEQIFIWAGCGGELLVAAFLVGLFFYRMPERFRWNVNRYIFLFAGFFSLLAASKRWIDSLFEPKNIPWGSIWQGFGPDGDLTRLHNEFGWSEDFIVYSYLITMALSWSYVGVHLLFFSKNR